MRIGAVDPKIFITDRHGVQVSFDVGNSPETKVFNGNRYHFNRTYGKSAPKKWVQDMISRLKRDGFQYRIVSGRLFNDVYVKPINLGRPRW